MAVNDGDEQLPDVELMLRARDGDRRSFEHLFRRHSRRVVSYLRRFVRDEALAEELAQEVFLRTYRARASYEPRAQFRTFLLRIATNLCLNELRRKVHRVRHEPLDAEPASDRRAAQSHELRDGGAGPEELVAARDLARAVEAAIAALPESQRAALLLLRYEGLSYEEIAATLDCGVPAVKSLLNRAKTSLRARLARELGEDSDALPDVP